MTERPPPRSRAHTLLRCWGLSGLIALACNARGVTPASGPGPERPNVLLIFVDDLGYGDLGSFGAAGWRTPHLDRLAREGVRLTDFYVAQPVCSASRAALLTGCYPHRIGIHGALGPASRIGIHADEVTLGELFRARGYATAHFGKWHLGHHPEFLPTRHGFDEYAGIPYSNDMWPFHPESPQAWVDLPSFEGERVVAYNEDQRRFTRRFTQRSADFIRRSVRAGRPFFCYLAQPMPHVPLHVSPSLEGASGSGLYGDVVQEIDAGVGDLLALLEAEGVADDTLVIFTSDNGPWLSYGDHAGGTGPLREGKGTTFEGGVRVPFVARWPGHIPAGAVVSEPAMTIDLFPTLAAWIGAELPGHPIDGRDIGALLLDEPGARTPHEAYFFYYERQELQALRAGRWKLHFPHGFRSMEGRAPGRDGIPGKYDYGRATGLELYDLELDAGEEVDLAPRRPEVVERLVGLAEVHRARLGDALQDVEGVERRAPGSLDAPR